MITSNSIFFESLQMTLQMRQIKLLYLRGDVDFNFRGLGEAPECGEGTLILFY